jgi:CheY-like chemotaxis protein
MATILVVDDEAANRLLVSTLLEYGGHEMFEASNAEDGLQLAKDQRPDLVIVDLNLRGTHGAQFIKNVRSDEHLRATKIVLYTGTQIDALLRDFMQVHGIAHVIPKPAEPEQLLQIVSDALGY